MNKQQAQIELEALKQKVADLEAVINEPESYGRNRVARWDVYYYYITGNGKIEHITDDRHSTDNYKFNTGNYYYTEAEAIKARDRQLAYMRIVDKLAELNKGWVPDWSNVKYDKFSINYSHCDTAFNIGVVGSVQLNPNELYGTKEACQWVIDNMQDDLEIWFEVPEVSNG